MRLLKNFKKLKASSLVESVIAIAIISICVLVVFMAYLNVINLNKSVYYYKAKHTVEFLTHESIEQQDYEDDVFKYRGYTVTKKVTINKEDQVVLLSFFIKTGHNEYQINKLIPYNE
ncbi:hypothetical protein [Flavivirga spongiicola]|uniref:Uncharacterized protein n=1 Tax=Flavivirga spongiicola TaxID=421621 RepID=A0ABU7XLY2_9FLAO|nr:hypothetical protein [Flavivirga sp. MEBiC05379]MDO5981431.1 hypothetical protein [Flavivirga sp. MEBiC05379]